jgi:hypothetical protein
MLRPLARLQRSGWYRNAEYVMLASPVAMKSLPRLAEGCDVGCLLV